MRCPENELDTCGKRWSGSDGQLVGSPDGKVVGCSLTCMGQYESRNFRVNQCESHVKSDLDTVSLSIDSRDARKLNFLIDTGAEISLTRSWSLTPGVNCQFHEEVDINGVSKAVMRTEGTVELKHFTETHETTHTFHVLGEDSEMHCDAILGKGFLEERDSVIIYCSRQLVMNDVIVNFDSKP